ncbi:hypothetical protein F5146DRAFT_1136932 [Armillaria mellea]|nr:hypothetical protein F5146DRAFT_1136932 [Armillaria mellea]
MSDLLTLSVMSAISSFLYLLNYLNFIFMMCQPSPPNTVLGISTSDVVMLTTSLKKLYDECYSLMVHSCHFIDRLPRFNASSPNASSVNSIPLLANRRFVCVPAGNTFAILNSIPPISAAIAPYVTRRRITNVII